jgi:hypothetical protein
MWVEYVKALGTPAVALLASLAAAIIAYRQWKTASNRLKLDFYDRRMEIYSSAQELINFVAAPLPIDSDHILNLSKAFGGAHWLLSPKVAKHLNGLAQRCWNNSATEGLKLTGMSREEKLAAAKKAVADEREIMDKEHQMLDNLFAPFLSVTH